MAELEYDIEQPYLGLIEKYRPKPDTDTLEQQKRLAKGSALANAFSLLIDAVGGAKGADIPQREILDPVTKAVDKYNTTRDKNRQEQQQWDQMQLVQQLKQMDTDKSMKFQDEQRLKGEEARKSLTEEERAARAEELRIQREMNASEIEEKGKQFWATLSNKQKQDIEENKIRSRDLDIKEKEVENRYGTPVNRVSDLVIQDEAMGKNLGFPKQMLKQVLTFLQNDPSVANNISIIQTKYDSGASAAAVEKAITDNFNLASDQTREKIRQFIGNNGATPQSGASTNPAEKFLFYKNTPQSQPAIKTSKKSTIVEVEGAPPPARVDYNTISSDEQQQIITIGSASQYTPEQRAKIAYDYMLKIGFDDASARSFAQGMLERLLGKLN